MPAGSALLREPHGHLVLVFSHAAANHSHGLYESIEGAAPGAFGIGVAVMTAAIAGLLAYLSWRRSRRAPKGPP